MKNKKLYDQISLSDYVSKFDMIVSIDKILINEIKKFFRKIPLNVKYQYCNDFQLTTYSFIYFLKIHIMLNEKYYNISIYEIGDDYFIVRVPQVYGEKYYICDGLDGLIELFNNIY